MANRDMQYLNTKNLEQIYGKQYNYMRKKAAAAAERNEQWYTCPAFKSWRIQFNITRRLALTHTHMHPYTQTHIRRHIECHGEKTPSTCSMYVFVCDDNFDTYAAYSNVLADNKVRPKIPFLMLTIANLKNVFVFFSLKLNGFM